MEKLSIQELAELFNVSERTILRQIQTISDKLKNPYSKAFRIQEDLANAIFSDKIQTNSDNENEEEFDYLEGFTTAEYVEFQKRINEYPVLKEYIENLKEQVEFLRFNSSQQAETIKDLSQGIKQRSFIEAKEKGFDKEVN
jgi:transcriptional antiterminator